MRQGRADEALADANRALDLAPHSPQGMCCQAAVLRLQNRTEEAAAVLSVACRLEPGNLEALGALLDIRGVRGRMLGFFFLFSWVGPQELRGGEIQG